LVSSLKNPSLIRAMRFRVFSCKIAIVHLHGVEDGKLLDTGFAETLRKLFDCTECRSLRTIGTDCPSPRFV
jgi:hypothetical protein